MMFKNLAATVAVICAAAVTMTTVADTEDKKPAGPAKIGQPAPVFTLVDVDGKTHNLADYKGKIVVLEWFNAGCPWSGKESGNSVHATGRVKKLIADAKTAKVEVVYLLVDSSANRDKATVVKENKAARAKFGIKQPILIDHDGKVGRVYGARTTPHMYVIDAKGVLQYNGAFGDRKAKPDGSEQNFVLAAIKNLKDGKPVTPAQTRPWGCGVKYAR